MNSSNAMKKGRFEAARLRGKDLNLRPLGYEPNELPLLHPAIYYKPEPSIVNGRKTVLGICGGTVMFGRGRNSGVVKWGLIGSAIAGGIALVPLVPVLKKRAMRATTI